MRHQPRDYQEYAIAKPFEYFKDHTGNPLMLMPTGSGKSHVVAGIVARALGWYPQTRIVMITESKELVAQNYAKLKDVWPEAPVGIYCDGLDRKQLHYPVTFGTIQSLISVVETLGFIDFVIVDEAHGISENEDTQYRQFMSKLARSREQGGNPNVKVVGLTATGFRMKQGMLTQGPNALFTDIIVDMTDLDSYNWFFEQGYLVPPIPRPTGVKYDLRNVKIKGGEYDQKSMQEEVDTQKKNEAVVLELLNHGQNRHCGIVFASGVDHCVHLAEIFEYYGERVTWVASRGMSSKQRDYNIQAYKEGEFKWMINNGILTTGFDHPPIDIMGIPRLILSPGLWGQMLGRGTRPLYEMGFDLTTREGRLAAIQASQKHNCMVLDFGNNTSRLGQINALRVPKAAERKRDGDAPIRICDACGCYCHASARTCWACGHEFPRYLKFDETSGTTALVAKLSMPALTAPEYKEIPVDRVTFQRWKKPGKADSIKVTYHCGFKEYSEWVLLDHEKWGGKARAWWRKFSNSNEVPPSVDVALEQTDKLRTPRAIEVAVNMQYGDIRSHIFD